MFLKNVKTILFKHLSLKVKLTLVFTIMIFILVTGVTLFSYWMLVHLNYHAEYASVSSEIEVMKYYISKNDDLAIQHEITEVKETEYPYQYYIRVYHPLTHKILETKGMSDIVPLHLSSKKAYWPHRKVHVLAIHNRYFLLMESYIPVESAVNLVQIILDISYSYYLIQTYQKYLLGALLLSALLSIALGYIIMKRSMRSLHDLTDVAHTITSYSLNQRINPEEWPKELRDLGIAFNQMLERIEESFLRQKQFSADLAHELRTPINTLMGATEVALIQSPPDTPYKEILESNLEDLKSIAKLIECLLFLAQAENPRLCIEKNNIEVHQEIGKLIEYFETVTYDKKMDISIQGETSLIANKELFGRLISNIFINALNNTPAGGHVHFNLFENPSHVHIEIKDTGIGISEEHLSRLFDRFYRVDQARSKKNGGFGLGLAIAKSIMDLHQGSITIYSQMGIGTRVLLEFPKQKILKNLIFLIESSENT